MNRKNKKIKEWTFWILKLYFPIVIIILVPILVSILVGGTLTVKEVSKLTATNLFTRALFVVAPNNQVATYATIGLLVFVITVVTVRKLKSTEVFNDNQSVYIHNCYKRLWVASKILGYKHLRLIGVSLPMQFEVIMNGTFPDFTAESSTTQYEKFDGEITVELLNNKGQNSKILNVLICDTYDISVQNIGAKFFSYPMLKISSSMTHTKLRYDNPKLVKAVREAMQEVDNQYDELNIFLTTNPLNALKIIGGSFTALDRSGFKKITVVQMNDDKIYADSFVIFES
ncbi:hypothetical protein [Lactococcus lactis]|uniref:hypothetical protein n=1 Tax=Lactococcus lactis TaxID=1358 RepID=UPI000513CE3D|nr:hypothetical protein [Lactococcus lactis]KGF77125.1 hypothetical protein Llab_0848 [Lactococcus lactis]